MLEEVLHISLTSNTLMRKHHSKNLACWLIYSFLKELGKGFTSIVYWEAFYSKGKGKSGFTHWNFLCQEDQILTCHIASENINCTHHTPVKDALAIVLFKYMWIYICSYMKNGSFIWQCSHIPNIQALQFFFHSSLFSKCLEIPSKGTRV